MPQCKVHVANISNCYFDRKNVNKKEFWTCFQHLFMKAIRGQSGGQSYFVELHDTISLKEYICERNKTQEGMQTKLLLKCFWTLQKVKFIQSNETPLFYFVPQRNQFQNKLKNNRVWTTNWQLLKVEHWRPSLKTFTNIFWTNYWK
jgi:hypothetical protein